jgi:Fe-S cluster assembly protein SufD
VSVIALNKPAAEVGGPLSGSEAQAAQPTRSHLAQAIRSGDLSILPGRRDEAWRWSDLRAAVRALPAASPEGAAPESGGPFADVAADDEIHVINGRTASLSDHTAATADRVLKLRVIATAQAGAHAAELKIDVAPGARLTILESYEGHADASVSALDLAITLGDGAMLERIVVLDEPAGAVSVSTADVTLQPHASFSQTVIATGAKLQRHETRLTHPGGGGAVRMDGLYLMGERRHFDLTTVVEHRGKDGQTTQLAKGVVSGRARGVFQGRIVVAHGADGTDARMHHGALILTEGAEIDAKPELEIYADDVQCAHGNTIGALDENALFYIASRGIPDLEARALLTEAHLGEVVERIAHEAARDAVRGFVASRLAEVVRG